jgi:hypothetical protein
VQELIDEYEACENSDYLNWKPKSEIATGLNNSVPTLVA